MSINIRQILNVVLAPSMWICATLPQMTGLGRTNLEQSLASDTLLVPYGLAFAIWFPIFVGCIIYGIVQAMPQNRTQPIFKAIGWWTAAGFALVCLWALCSAYPPIVPARWLTALIFIPAVLCLCQAVVIGTRRKDEFIGSEKYLLWPLSWIAGWCSLAAFLNWAQLGVHDVIGFGMPPLIICLLTLAAALGWAVIMLRRTSGNYAYLFPIVWGLAFLIYARLGQTPTAPPIAIAAGLGALVLIGTAIKLRLDAKRA